MASLYRRGKRYWLAYCVNGRRVDRSLFTINLRVARDKKRKIEYELAIGNLHQASKLPLVPVLEAFCKHLQATRTYMGVLGEDMPQNARFCDRAS